MDTAKQIENGSVYLGIELGSTRIKAVLIDSDHAPIASGDFTWENELADGLWTYSLDAVDAGLKASYKALKEDVKERYGVTLKKLGGLGISAMMHGYLAFDRDGKLLVPFRTWRNTNTGKAAAKLSELFGFNIPLRWSISHLYECMLDNEPHVASISSVTTLAGYVHEILTGKHVLGVGDASGMFPIDSTILDYDKSMVEKFDELAKDMPWKLTKIFPKVLPAGADAGTLTAKGALFLDPDGDLEAGIKVAPPEGDAGTGMAATCSVKPGTGNVSAGTSVFAMAVLDKALDDYYPEIDMVTTPSGAPVAMVHCNNCTSDINAWANVFAGFAKAAGLEVSMGTIFTSIFRSAMAGDADCGGLLDFAFLSGEPVVGLDEGRPLFVRLPDAKLTFENFARTQVYAAMAALKKGMEILDREGVKLSSMMGHGGFFKTPGTAQKLMASALNIPITTMETAGEGGAWGMAILAAFAACANGEKLEDYLETKVFTDSAKVVENPESKDIEGFTKYMDRFTATLPAEKKAVELFL